MNTDEPECGWAAKVEMLEVALQAQTESVLYFKRLAAQSAIDLIDDYDRHSSIDHAIAFELKRKLKE